MSIFSIKFSYTSDQVVFRKTAIVRATTPDLAKQKVVDSLQRLHSGKSFESFSFENITVSSYNYIFI